MRLKKKIAVIGLLSALVVFGLWVFFYEGAGPTFMDEVKGLRAKDRPSKGEIHDLVAKYVPVGTPEEAALKFCKANGLEIYLYPVYDKRSFPGKDPKTVDEMMLCSKDMMKEWYLFWTWWAWYDEVRVTMDLKDGAVVKIKGFIFTHAL